jgi:hypothetical protein
LAKAAQADDFYQVTVRGLVEKAESGYDKV